MTGRRVLAALGIAVAIVLGYGALWRFTPVFEPDSPGYVEVAADLAAGGPHRLWARTLGYPAFLVLTSAVPEPGAELVAAQLALHAAAVLAVACALRSLGVSRAGAIIFIAIACTPPFVEHAAFVLSESCVQALVIGALVGWLAWTLSAARVGLGVVALCVGAVGIVHPRWAVLAPVLLVASVGCAHGLPALRSARGRILGGGLALLVAVGIALGGTVAFNGARFGYAGLSPLLGVTLSHKTVRLLERLPAEYDDVREILLRHRDAALVDPRGDHLAYGYVFRALPELEQTTGLRDADLDGYLTRMNLALIRRGPMEYLDEVGRSVLWWASPGVSPVGSLGSGMIGALGRLLRVLVLAASGAGLVLVTGPSLLELLARRRRPHAAASERERLRDARSFALVLFVATIAASALVPSLLTSAVWRHRVPVDLLILGSSFLCAVTWRDLRDSS